MAIEVKSSSGSPKLFNLGEINARYNPIAYNVSNFNSYDGFGDFTVKRVRCKRLSFSSGSIMQASNSNKV